MSRTAASLGVRARVLVPVIAALAVAPALPSAAQANVDAHVAIVAPEAHVVSGIIPLAARAFGSHLRKIVFTVDGHNERTSTLPSRDSAGGKLNTHGLREGVHVLAVEAIYSNHRDRVARQRMVVHNALLVNTPLGRKHHHGPTPPTPPVTTPPVVGTPGSSVTQFNRETYSYSTSLSTSQEANRYQVLVLQSTDGPQVKALKAANPNLKVLVYQHPWFARVSDPGALGVCTSYPSDVANHQSWFVKDRSGNNVPTKAGGNYVMDIGNPSYQQACAANAISLAKKYGFDGVYFDGIASTTRFDTNTALPEYPTDTSWQQATTSFLTAAVTDLHAQGLEAFGNLCGTALTPGLWQHWSSILDGSEEESWTDGGLGPAQQVSQWSTKLADVVSSEASGKYTLLHSYNTSETGNTYGLGSMLLAAGGLTSYSTSNANYTSNEANYPEYTTAALLGAPIGKYSQLSNGVYERTFANGLVLVNPTTSSVPSFSLGGGIYSGSQLNNVSSVTMGATSGLIMLKVG
jgi:hypothetical protein